MPTLPGPAYFLLRRDRRHPVGEQVFNLRLPITLGEQVFNRLWWQLTASAVFSGVAAATALASRKSRVAGRNVRNKVPGWEMPGLAELVSRGESSATPGRCWLRTSDPMLRPATRLLREANAVAAAMPLDTADAVAVRSKNAAG